MALFCRIPQILSFVLATALCSFCSVTNYYIAQATAGSGNGSSCANANSAAFFNTAGNWGTVKTIGPGTTVHVCGNLTTALTFQASGASGNPVTLFFEPGASMSTAVWSNAIVIRNLSYLVIDGGVPCGTTGGSCNGYIANTNNGTAGSHSTSQAIVANNCSNCEVRNLGIYNIYVHSGSNAEIDQTQVNCMVYSGVNFLIHDNTMHDAGWCLYMNSGNAQGQRVYNNNLYNIDHGIAVTPGGNHAAAGPWYFYNNHLHDYANWDTSSNAYHHDGIHCYTVDGRHAAQEYGAAWGDMWIYNNLFDGNIGNNVTGHIFLEPGVQTDGTATPCMDGTSILHIFGNVLLGTTANGGADLGRASFDPLTHALDFYNNTVFGPNASSNRAVVFENVNLVNAKNNIVGGANKLWDGVSFTATDYNGYINCPTGTSYNCWPVSGGTNNFSTWRGQCACDAHAVNSQANFDGVNSATGALQTSSLMIGAGTNLASVVSSWPTEQQNALTTDRSGIARGGGAWSIGAYGTTGTSPQPPTNLTAAPH